MAGDLQAVFTANSVAAFQSALRYANATGYKSPRNAVKWGAILFAQSARKGTKVARKMRGKVQNPGFLSAAERSRIQRAGGEIPKGSNARWAIEAYGQGQGRYLIPVIGKKSDIVQRVPNRGLSRGSWGWMLSKMNKPAGPDAGMNATGREVVDVHSQLQGANPTIRMRNALYWIEAANPGVVGQSLRKAANTMVKRIDNDFRKAGF
jgi:hypothetical protein